MVPSTSRTYRRNVKVAGSREGGRDLVIRRGLPCASQEKLFHAAVRGKLYCIVGV